MPEKKTPSPRRAAPRNSPPKPEQPGTQTPEAKSAKKITLEDLGLTAEEMETFAQGARFLFGPKDT